MKLKTIMVPRGYDGLHVELEGGLVNIHTKLKDMDGRPVVRVSVDADADRYKGDPQWWCPDLAKIGLDPGGVGIRIVQLDAKPDMHIPSPVDRFVIASAYLNNQADENWRKMVKAIVGKSL